MESNKKPSWHFVDVFFGLALYYLVITLWDMLLTKLNITGNTFFVLISLIGGLALVVILTLFLNSNRNQDKMSWDSKELSHNLFIGIVIGGVIGLISSISILVNGTSIFSLFSLEGLEANYGHGTFMDHVFFLIAFILLIPISEELFFRGWMFSALKNKFHWVIAALITALFSSVFLVGNINFVFLILMGIVFAVAYEKTGSIFTSIVSHMVCNLIITIMIWIKGGS
ncbi:hypothetical protein AZF37_06780 [endosymbiont 'TC1' of Trimyema compressum]|uniref:CPBP family intramembrane glutamic endopeptidase n=1 Tax=endosymbiont 'TC1' of Trimyema compressum TaxID=243899 RepID=UPI0007F0F4A1|nr:type II CAAX endopeptidase family protein [endosymbiont 'TC1' of Trimyema compressum]AMP20906.1 hypothetical protein AZF37_06780 [endosymbiont 'TC1' of Trimyema compressum]